MSRSSLARSKPVASGELSQDGQVLKIAIRCERCGAAGHACLTPPADDTGRMRIELDPGWGFEVKVINHGLDLPETMGFICSPGRNCGRRRNAD